MLLVIILKARKQKQQHQPQTINYQGFPQTPLSCYTPLTFTYRLRQKHTDRMRVFVSIY